MNVEIKQLPSGDNASAPICPEIGRTVPKGNGTTYHAEGKMSATSRAPLRLNQGPLPTQRYPANLDQSIKIIVVIRLKDAAHAMHVELNFRSTDGLHATHVEQKHDKFCGKERT